MYYVCIDVFVSEYNYSKLAKTLCALFCDPVKVKCTLKYHPLENFPKFVVKVMWAGENTGGQDPGHFYESWAFAQSSFERPKTGH